MKPTFEEIKKDFAEKCKAANACLGEFTKLLASTNEDELLKVIYENLSWCASNKVISTEFFNQFSTESFLNSGISNTGKENTGFTNSGDSNSGDSNSGNWNSGYRNSGNRNSGDSNSGNWNSGDRNSGDRNSGYRNSGDSNSGDSNSGYSNSGDRNSGDRNSGNWNSGDRNSGDSNSGYWNSGDRNSGNRNSGYSNSGDSNSGDSNSGNRNSGNWNSGDRNSGDSNSGYRNSGAFCTETNPTLVLFDKPTNILVKDWEQSEVCSLMYSIDPTIWVPMSIMTDEEKESYPKYETTEGYLKTIPMKEAWLNFWGNLKENKKKLFTDLPNFDAEKFEQITGIKI